MAGDSKIEWTDATVNFWWGCTKVGPGCDHCYAEAWDKRTGGAHWGLNAPRRKIASAVKLIHKLDYANWAAEAECRIGNAKAFGLPVPNIGPRRRVFIQSMSDLFDLEVPLEWFAEAWGRIEVCNRIDVQIVTKRISAVEKRLAAIGATTWPRHVGLIVTVVNQDEADRDVPRLLALKAKFNIPWVGLSIEPMLGPIRLDRLTREAVSQIYYDDALTGFKSNGCGGWQDEKLDWVIVGGESGKDARAMHPQWARDLRDQCAEAGVPFFFKQWGEWAPSTPEAAAGNPRSGWKCMAGHPHVAKAAELYPQAGAAFIEHKGKKAAGRHLDGVLHDAMPQADGRGRG